MLAANTSLCHYNPYNGTAHSPYIGTFETEALCRDACTAQPNCTMYTWDNMSQSYPGAVELRHHCYGRNDNVWMTYAVPNAYSGRRVAPAPAPTPTPPPAPVAPGEDPLHSRPFLLSFLVKDIF